MQEEEGRRVETVVVQAASELRGLQEVASLVEDPMAEAALAVAWQVAGTAAAGGRAVAAQVAATLEADQGAVAGWEATVAAEARVGVAVAVVASVAAQLARVARTVVMLAVGQQVVG